jgi:hypothetical protein
MQAELESPVAFHITGKRSGAELAPVTERGLRPALFARYRDLTALRYDFPLVLLKDARDGDCVASLSALIDKALEGASGTAGERLRAHALRLEREIRVMTAAGAIGPLGALLEQAARRVAPTVDPALAESLASLRGKLKADGEVLDCDVRMPARLIAHAWAAAQRQRTDAVRSEIERLVVKLSDILRADTARSEGARSPASLRATVGSAHGELFDFDAMSRLLKRAVPAGSLAPGRRARIERTLTELRGQRFYAVADGTQPYAFRFGDCASALQAFLDRAADMARFARAITIARLEIDGGYSEERHDALFAQLGENRLDLSDLALFPDYLVCINTRALSATEHGELMEILASGLPMKILVQSDDILEPPLVQTGHLAFGTGSRQLASVAIGLNDVFVLQSASSNLLRARAQIRNAMQYRGPALLSVFSGASPHADGVRPYLNAAAAMESRAFPAFGYDPSAGKDWASRFTLADNPQPERDWPLHVLTHEDAEHQSVAEETAFTLLDYVACDSRFADHYAKVPRAAWNETLAPASECLDAGARGLPDKLPSVPMVDADDRLQKVIVDERLLREAVRCRDFWRSLQELGGINNSHVAKALARAAAEAKPAAPQAQPVAATAAPAASPAAAPAPAVSAEPAQERSADEPYIETPRCSTCNECTQINNRMFAYDENQQARIVDATAGTFRQLVEAAESCQVAIIHPGKPKNPDEPGLEELLKRAEAFR